MTERSHALARELTAEIEELEIAFHEAYWESQVEASEENDGRRAELELELRKVKGDEAALRRVDAALDEDIHDPLLRRHLEVLRLSLAGNQMTDDQRRRLVDLSTTVESEFASFRPVVDGRRLSDNDIEEGLRTSADAATSERLWRASKEIGGRVSDNVRELARVRNATAHDLGYADFYRMELELQELSEEWLFGVMDDLERATEEPFRIWKMGLDSELARRFRTAELYPWHYSDPFFQSLPPDGRVSLDGLLKDTSAEELARKTFGAWDIDLTGVLERSDLYPRERKCQHAFCLSIDRLDDVRILANVVPGERWTEVMLHESGHAAYDVCIDRRMPYTLRRPTHTFVTEAIALLSGRLVRDPQWLSTIAGVDASAVAGVADEARRAVAAQNLLFARWGLVMVHFERDLYSDPEADLDARWWELVERLQLIAAPPDGSPEGAWAAKIHTAVAPVYYHNYLLGDVLASQLSGVAVKECGALAGSPAAGRFLKDRVFRPGALLRWDATVEQATGGPLRAEELVASLAL